eukprot:2387859-Pleurochrysis_carterae.AAC.3
MFFCCTPAPRPPLHSVKDVQRGAHGDGGQRKQEEGVAAPSRPSQPSTSLLQRDSNVESVEDL